MENKEMPQPKFWFGQEVMVNEIQRVAKVYLIYLQHNKFRYAFENIVGDHAEDELSIFVKPKPKKTASMGCYLHTYKDEQCILYCNEEYAKNNLKDHKPVTNLRINDAGTGLIGECEE